MPNINTNPWKSTSTNSKSKKNKKNPNNFKEEIKVKIDAQNKHKHIEKYFNKLKERLQSCEAVYNMF